MFTVGNKFKVSFFSRLDNESSIGVGSAEQLAWPYMPGNVPNFRASRTPPVPPLNIPVHIPEDPFYGRARHSISDLGAEASGIVIGTLMKTRRALQGQKI